MCKQLGLIDFQHKSIKIMISVMHQFLKKLVFWIEQNIIINVDLQLFFSNSMQYVRLRCNIAYSAIMLNHWVGTFFQDYMNASFRGNNPVFSV